MKRTLIIISILIVSALVGCLWLRIDESILEKSHPLEFREYVEEYSERYSVPEEVIYAVMKTESDFTSDAVSDKGAIGLMQVTPETYDWLCSKEPTDKVSERLLYDPETNIHYGTLFLSILYTEFGTWDNVYAAYNAGRGKVNEWLADPEISTNGKLVNIPYSETADYVVKVRTAAENYAKLYYNNENIEEATVMEDAP